MVKYCALVTSWMIALAFCLPSRADEITVDKLNEQGLRSLHEGKLKDAEKYFDLAIKESNNAGVSPQKLAISLNNLALLRLDQRQFLESETLFLRATDMMDKLCANDNLELVTMLENTGTAFFRHGKLAEAEPWLRRALAMYEQMLERDDVDLASCLIKLADLYNQEERSDEAGPLYYRAASLCLKSTKSNTEVTSLALERLSSYHQSQGRYKEAGKLLDQAVEVCSKLDSMHPTRVHVEKRKSELKEAERRPNLIVLRPKEGEIFDDEPIFVQLMVENFKVMLPELHFGSPTPGDCGHIHIMFDSYPLVATTSTQIMFGKAAGDSYLPKGKHTLTVELVHDTHGSLTPPIVRTVTFYTAHSGNQSLARPE